MKASVLAALLALLTSAPAAAAERNFSVTSFDRIRVDGPYKVHLAVGVAPFATASGSSQALDGLAIGVEGRTLVVHFNRSSWGGYNGQSAGPVEISLGTHELSAAWVNGSGTLAIDQVKGLAFDLAVQGSGAASIERVAVDQLHVALAGAASARLGGAGLKMTAIVRGSSSLDAAALALKDVTIGAEGPAIVKVQASDTAKVDAMGVAAVSLTGSPACVVKTQGSASVEGCR
ncbi:MAG: DUF2807 domain-containing protein [Sphingomicrobium sp.]